MKCFDLSSIRRSSSTWFIYSWLHRSCTCLSHTARSIPILSTHFRESPDSGSAPIVLLNSAGAQLADVTAVAVQTCTEPLRCKMCDKSCVVNGRKERHTGVSMTLLLPSPMPSTRPQRINLRLQRCEICHDIPLRLLWRRLSLSPFVNLP